MSETVIAAADFARRGTFVGRPGTPGVSVDVSGSHRFDWGHSVVAAPQVNGDVSIVAIDPDSGALTEFGSIPNVDETVIATLDPVGDLAYISGASFGLVSLSRSGEVTRLIAQGSPPEFAGLVIGLGPVEWSPSGRTLGVSACSEQTCVTSIIDITTGSVNRIPGFVMGAISDEYVLGYSSLADRSWKAMQILSRETSPIGPGIDVAYHGYFVDGTSALISGGAEAGLSLRMIDFATGADREVMTVTDGRLLADLWRSDRWAVLTSPFVRSLTEAVGNGGTYWDLLDLESGEILAGVVPVGF